MKKARQAAHVLQAACLLELAWAACPAHLECPCQETWQATFRCAPLSRRSINHTAFGFLYQSEMEADSVSVSVRSRNGCLIW